MSFNTIIQLTLLATTTQAINVQQAYNYPQRQQSNKPAEASGIDKD
jgi:hypothetical protein